MNMSLRKRVVMICRWIPVVVLAFGCGERRTSLKVTGYGTATAIVGGGLVGLFARGEEAPGGPIALGANMFIIGSAVAVVAGVASLFEPRGDADAPERVPAKPTVDQAGRVRAWELTKAAALAARREDCAEVREASVEILALDAELHAVVFLRDVAIARCLEN